MSLITQDLHHVWHPCSYLKDFEKAPPLVVTHAKGSYLYTPQGPIIDAISSWWCKSLGHGHPAVIAAIQAQLQKFEHVIGANTTHDQIVALAETLACISGNQHVYFASDGSCAVEIALKLAVHAMQLQDRPERNQVIALKNAYHGETIGALSVSDIGVYKQPYARLGLTCHFIQNIPYLQSNQDGLWSCCDPVWDAVLAELTPWQDKACALILEPIVQGAGGMLCYSADFLHKLARWAKDHAIYVIADEIMTGLGRTGKWLACHHAGIQPDMICLSKGLSAGSVPLSCVLVDHALYTLFYQDYETGKAFLHSHTYSGNALAIAAALATVKTMQTEDINQQAIQLGEVLQSAFLDIAKLTGKLTNIRGIGGLVAGDLVADAIPRVGHRLAQEALARGALLRPIGNTLYWLPPLNTDQSTIEKLAEITLHSIKAVYL